MRKYEVIFIVKPMEEDATNAVIEKFSNLIQNNGGTIDKEDRWGKKRLAYEKVSTACSTLRVSRHALLSATVS